MAIPLLTGRKERPSPNEMTLTQHLGEIRRRVLISAVVYAAATTVAFILYAPLLHALQHPYCQVNPGHNAFGQQNCQLYVTGPLDGLTLRLKMAAFGGLVLASPVILWQIWRFVTPGLRPREKRYAVPFVLVSVVLFVGGCVIAYEILPHTLSFLKAVGGPQLHQILSPNQYLSLVLILMLLFGIAFEFPVLLVSLELANVVTPARLLGWWRWAVIGITAVAAVFTPSSDPFSMLALAVPLVAFYFLAILIGKLFGR